MLENVKTEIGTASDVLDGVESIASFIGKSKRRTFYLCEKRQIPAFKLGGKWHLRKSTYWAHIEKLELDSRVSA